MHEPREPDPSLFAEPVEPVGPTPAELELRDDARNSRYGLWLFSVYVLLYGGFILLSTFRPRLMGRTLPGGVNVAILYGIGLIVAALVLALIYMYLCRASAGDTRRAPR